MGIPMTSDSSPARQPLDLTQYARSCESDPAGCRGPAPSTWPHRSEGVRFQDSTVVEQHCVALHRMSRSAPRGETAPAVTGVANDSEEPRTSISTAKCLEVSKGAGMPLGPRRRSAVISIKPPRQPVGGIDMRQDDVVKAGGIQYHGGQCAGRTARRPPTKPTAPYPAQTRREANASGIP